MACSDSSPLRLHIAQDLIRALGVQHSISPALQVLHRGGVQPLLHSVRLALITTVAPYQPPGGEQGPGVAYNAAAKFYRVYSVPADTALALRISPLGYDHVHTTAEDMS